MDYTYETFNDDKLTEILINKYKFFNICYIYFHDRNKFFRKIYKFMNKVCDINKKLGDMSEKEKKIMAENYHNLYNLYFKPGY